MNKGLLKILLLLSLGSVYGAAEVPVSNEAITSRLQNMSKLLHDSSGARQVINSANSEAKLKRQQALELYQQANEKHKNGAYEDAVKLLNRSAQLMFEAIQISTPSALLENKKILNYEQRKESVMALRDAFERISDETHDIESRQKVKRQLEQLITRADEFLHQGDNNRARVEIDKAYHLLKVSIEAKRAGQTLVRSLQFETKEEEYHYEVDRNDTHNMLVSLLVDEKEKSDYTRKEIVKFVEEAERLREQADAYAVDDAYEIAIGLLEQSTKQLVRAIRTAGIYIPG